MFPQFPGKVCDVGGKFQVISVKKINSLLITLGALLEIAIMKIVTNQVLNWSIIKIGRALEFNKRILY